MIWSILACSCPDHTVHPAARDSMTAPVSSTIPLPLDTYAHDTSPTIVDTGPRFITDECEPGQDYQDDCGYTYRGLTGCLIGDDVNYDFGPDPLLEEQVLRICRTTRSEGVPCFESEAVGQVVGWRIRFRCPDLIPGGDPDAVIGGNGGGFSIYTADARG